MIWCILESAAFQNLVLVLKEMSEDLPKQPWWLKTSASEASEKSTRKTVYSAFSYLNLANTFWFSQRVHAGPGACAPRWHVLPCPACPAPGLYAPTKGPGALAWRQFSSGFLRARTWVSALSSVLQQVLWNWSTYNDKRSNLKKQVYL